ncbi:MAG: hypothetical protein DLM71_10165 [Chloroflexi bacterium]|nr:MAG: hypothetical protein DLM71_10165 [Chloroflexota bacterium]
MINRAGDPRTEDTIVFDLLRMPAGASEPEPEPVGSATFRAGRATVEAPEAISVAVEELLSRAFVDRVHSDERPRGYRRTGQGMVDMLVPGMPEHFIARLRGLWLSYPDGSVVTARRSGLLPGTAPPVLWGPRLSEAGAPVTDPAVRRASLALSDRATGRRPLVRGNPPMTGLRPADQPTGVRRTDCGWPV